MIIIEWEQRQKSLSLSVSQFFCLSQAAAEDEKVKVNKKKTVTFVHNLHNS